MGDLTKKICKHHVLHHIWEKSEMIPRLKENNMLSYVPDSLSLTRKDPKTESIKIQVNNQQRRNKQHIKL